MRQLPGLAALAAGVLAASAAVAGEAAPAAPQGPSGGILKWIADNPFTATLLFLVLATLLGTIISRFVRDRCLKDFEGYPVSLELKDGRIYHGELDVEKSGLEFLYERTAPQEGLTKTSFLIFQPEYATLHALLRYHDRLSEQQMRARERAAQKAYHPNIFRRSWRALRNFLAAVKDSLIEAFRLVMGRVKGIQAAAPVMQTGGGYIDRVGQQAIGTAADVTYDPLLEKQIGLRVVVQLPRDAAAQDEFVGTFREYTKDFFELMDVDYEARWEVALPAPGTAAFERGVAAQRTPEGVHVENCATFPVQLAAVRQEAAEGAGPPPPPLQLPVTIPSGEKLDFPLAPEVPGLALVFATRRKADVVVPRTGAFVRHKSEWAMPRKLIGHFQEAVGLLPGTHRVVSALKQGAQLVSAPTSPATVPFVKMHGCGNDYIYIDCRSRTLPHPARLARRLSDRHFGIGADGLILILPSRRADFRMRIFNADGSEAEMCGNGIRCFAKYLYDRGLLEGEQATIETRAGDLQVHVVPENGRAVRARVNMGPPRLERADIPMEGPPGQVVGEELTIELPHQGPATVRVTALSMGNPHCVTFVDDVGDYPVEVHGPLLENHRAFPQRTNVEFVQVLSRDEVKMRVWERGSGETLACGTGASAVAVAGALAGKTERQVTVRVPGGVLELDWAQDGCVYLSGPVEEVFEGLVEV
ncbi:MAG: diaminopimelate epimerase [Candidatus Brocadiia bacterium]